MADKAGMIRWFLEELPGLRESGIINPDTEENLKGYYLGETCRGAVSAEILSAGVVDHRRASHHRGNGSDFQLQLGYPRKKSPDRGFLSSACSGILPLGFHACGKTRAGMEGVFRTGYCRT